MANINMASSLEVLGERASRPCDISDAHGVAVAINRPGLDIELQPFRHPPLLDSEIRIKVSSCGLCQGDTSTMQFPWAPICYPYVPGHEIFGTVTHVGEKVTNLQIGDRVGHGPMRNWCSNCSECNIGFNNNCKNAELTFASLHYGGLATSYQAPAKGFIKVPESIADSSAPLTCAGTTCYSPLSRDLVSGMKVGVVGVGGLGHLGIKMANCMGCEVTAISTSPDKEEEAKSLGAHHFLNSKDAKQLQNAHRSLDYVLDTTGADFLDASLKLLRPNGVVHFVGLPHGENKKFNAFDIVTFNLTIKSAPNGPIGEVSKMFEFCELHNIRCMSEMYKFSDAKLAIDSLALGVPRPPRYRAVVETASFFENFTPSN